MNNIRQIVKQILTENNYQDFIENSNQIDVIRKDLRMNGFDADEVIRGIGYSKKKGFGATLRYHDAYMGEPESYWLDITPYYSVEDINDLLNDQEVRRAIDNEDTDITADDLIKDSDMSFKMEWLDTVGYLRIGDHHALSIDNNGNIQWD